MHISFIKMQGLGNDFVVIDVTEQPLELTAAQIQRLADRHYGVGCDQVLVLRPALTPTADFAYQIFNADGTVVEQCGNGARCLGRYLYGHKRLTKSPLRLAAPKGEIEVALTANGLVTVNMGRPTFTPAAVPFMAEQQAVIYPLAVDDQTVSIGVVALGNPHAVIKVTAVTTAPVAVVGAAIENHPRFPQRTNVEFMQVLDRQRIRLRVFERGVGETLACGSGACAAVVIGRRWRLLDSEVAVDLPGGRLQVRWEGTEDSPVWLSGPAETVFEGRIQL